MDLLGAAKGKIEDTYDAYRKLLTNDFGPEDMEKEDDSPTPAEQVIKTHIVEPIKQQASDTVDAYKELGSDMLNRIRDYLSGRNR